MMPQHIKEYLENRGLNTDYFGYGNYYGTNWVTIPVKDINGKTIFLKLRKDPLEPDTVSKYRFFPYGNNSCLFGQELLSTYSDYVIICEGEFDCLLLRSHGLNAITSTAGAGTFKEEWIEQIKHIKDIYICFDNDNAGLIGVKKIVKKLSKYYDNLFIIEIPEVKDVTDYFLAGKDIAKIKELSFAADCSGLHCNKELITKKQYEQEESRLLSQRVLWTDKLRQGTNGGNWFIKWRVTETEDSLCRVRRMIAFASKPVNKDNNIDIALVKSVPIGNLYDVTAAGFFVNNPLRPEKSPSNSLHWNKKNNTWKDFGSDERGDNIDMVMRDKKCGFKEACEHILRFI